MTEDDDRLPDSDEGGGTATLTALAPPLTATADLTRVDEYEIRVYDFDRGRALVAAIGYRQPSAGPCRSSRRGSRPNSASNGRWNRVIRKSAVCCGFRERVGGWLSDAGAGGPEIGRATCKSAPGA